MNIPLAAITALLAANPELSAGQLPIERVDAYLNFSYKNGNQVFSDTPEDTDDFWPDDGNVVHFLDASGRHVFARREGPQLIMLLEIEYPAIRGEIMEFYEQTVSVEAPDQILLRLASIIDFWDFLQHDVNGRNFSMIETLYHQARFTTVHSQEGNDSMNTAENNGNNAGDMNDAINVLDGAQRFEKAGAKAGHQVDRAIGKVGETLGETGDHIRAAAASTGAKLEDVGGRVKDAASDAGERIQDKVEDLGDAARGATIKVRRGFSDFIADLTGDRYRTARVHGTYLLGGVAIGTLLGLGYRKLTS